MTVVLALSPPAAALVRDAASGIANGLRSQGWDEDSDSPITPSDLPLLDAIVAEIDAQNARDAKPEPASPELDTKAIANAMAAAAKEAATR